MSFKKYVPYKKGLYYELPKLFELKDVKYTPPKREKIDMIIYQECAEISKETWEKLQALKRLQKGV